MPQPALAHALAAATIAGSTALAAWPARAATDWLCSLSDDGLRLLCVADDDLRAEAAAPAAPADR